jgi:hypothetical protein
MHRLELTKPDGRRMTLYARAPLPPELQALIKSKEAEVVATRREAIALLRSYLGDATHSDETAEALFKLAELIWEEAQQSYLQRMGEHLEAVEACRKDRAQCSRVARRAPRLDLSQAQSTYERLVREYPHFRKIDTVIYLYAFSLRDQGRLDASVAEIGDLDQLAARASGDVDADERHAEAS